jgi:hypothetical protein
MSTSERTTAGDASLVAGPPVPRWPLTIEEFLDGPWLEPADILLMRERSSLFARLVRLFTGSYFSKAAMMFIVPHRERDFAAPYVIEAAFEGVDLTDLSAFVHAREKRFVIAVKRFEANWFEREERHLVRGFMLNHIKADYDYGRLFDNLWAALKGSYFYFIRIILGPYKALRLFTKRKPAERLNKFIGPGFVQWGYWEATKFLVDNGLLPRKTLDDVVFREALLEERANGSEFSDDDLLSVTAEDLAKSPRLNWKYAIVDGRVWEIESEGAFHALLAELKNERRGGGPSA